MPPPWMIVVHCFAHAVACEQGGMPDLGANQHATRPQCERALLEAAEKFKPAVGGYVFNCRRWPW